MKNAARSLLFALSLAVVTLVSSEVPAQADAPLVSTTGTVVSRDGDVLVVRTDKGNLTFDIDKNTEMPLDLAVNSRITVWYDSDDKPEDRMDARRIVMAPVEQVTTPVTPAPVVETTPRTEVQTETREVTTTDDTDSLPATSSALPLLAGIALVTLLGSALMIDRRRN